MSELIQLIITEPPTHSTAAQEMTATDDKASGEKEEEDKESAAATESAEVDDDSAPKDAASEEEKKEDHDEEEPPASMSGYDAFFASSSGRRLSGDSAPSPLSDDVATRFKYPHIASEILTCEVQQINEKISSDEALLGQLYSFMEEGEPPLNPLLCSFFSKAFGVLITRKTEQNWYSYQYNCVQVFEFLKKKELVSDLLRHIGTSAISDLILRLITCVDGTDIKQSLLDVSLLSFCSLNVRYPVNFPPVAEREAPDPVNHRAS